MDIPEIIKETARQYGFNSINYIGEKDGAQAFSVCTGIVDENGIPIPTGLPTLFLLRGDDVIIKHGLEALNLF